MHEDQWKSIQNQWKSFENNENKWKSMENQWKSIEKHWKSMKINENQWKSIENQWKSLKMDTFWGTFRRQISTGNFANVIFFGKSGGSNPRSNPTSNPTCHKAFCTLGGGTPTVPLGLPLFSTDVQSTVDTEEWRLKPGGPGTMNTEQEWTLNKIEYWTLSKTE